MDRTAAPISLPYLPMDILVEILVKVLRRVPDYRARMPWEQVKDAVVALGSSAPRVLDSKNLLLEVVREVVRRADVRIVPGYHFLRYPFGLSFVALEPSWAAKVGVKSASSVRLDTSYKRPVLFLLDRGAPYSYRINWMEESECYEWEDWGMLDAMTHGYDSYESEDEDEEDEYILQAREVLGSGYFYVGIPNA